MAKAEAETTKTEQAASVAVGRWRWWLAGVIALAVALRVLLPGLVPLDEPGAGALLRAEQVRGGALVFTGAPAGGDLVQPPTGAWLDALALRLWADPRALVVLHGLVAAVAAALVWDAARHAWGRQAGLVAALAYALHPLAVHAARDLSAVAWVAPVAALALHGLAMVFCQNDRRGWLEAVVAAGLALGLHLAAWPVAAAVLLAAACFPRRAQVAEAALGLGLGLLMALPHLAYQARYGGYDLLGALGAGSAAPMAGLGAGLRALLASVSTWEAASGLVPPLPNLLGWLSALLGGAAVLLVVRNGLRRWARALVLADVPLELLAADWLILMALGVALTSRDLAGAGVSLLIPAVSLCVGAAAAMPVPSSWRRARAGLLAALLVAWGATTLSSYDGAIYGVVRPSLREASALRAALAEQVPATAKLYVVAVHESATPYGTGGWRWLLGERASSLPDAGDDAIALPLPLGQEAYYLLESPTAPLEALEALGAEALALPNDGRGYTPLLYRLPPVDPIALLELADQRADVAFGDALHLLGYGWEEADPSVSQRSLRTLWLVHRAVSDDPRLLVQLVGSAGVWAEAEGLGYPAEAWEADTAVIAWHPLALHDERAADGGGDAALVIGWYDPETLAPWPPLEMAGDAYLAAGAGAP